MMGNLLVLKTIKNQNKIKTKRIIYNIFELLLLTTIIICTIKII